MNDGSKDPLQVETGASSRLPLWILLGTCGILLLTGLMLGLSVRTEGYTTGLKLTGSVFLLMAIAIAILLVALAYAAYSRHRWSVMSAAIPGVFLGGFGGMMLLTEVPDARRQASYERSMEGKVLVGQEYANHTADHITEISVEGKGSNSVRAYQLGGGGGSSGVVIPGQWRPGLEATVRWTTSSSDPTITPEQNVIRTHEKVVPIERYETPGKLNVHFLPDGEIRVIVWKGSPRSEGYAGPAAPVPPPDWSPWLRNAHVPLDADTLPSPPSTPSALQESR